MANSRSPITGRDTVNGGDPTAPYDLLLINAPLRDYTKRPRVNDFTLPVLGLGYIATYAQSCGFNVGVLDAEAHGLPIHQVAQIVNELHPRWAGFNLLAPTYEMSATIAAALDEQIQIMAGGHQAKAMPLHILGDPRFRRLQALILGEAETRVAELLGGTGRRNVLPGVMWMGEDGPASGTGNRSHLAPDIDQLHIDRGFLACDPYPSAGGRTESALVGARGCPYDCTFCGAAVSANPDITIRVRDPYRILDEMAALKSDHGVTAFRFVDDLFLGVRRVIDQMMTAFERARAADWAVWDATGRINVLDRCPDQVLDSLLDNGLREVALGIESGSPRMLDYIDKRTTPDMAAQVVRRLTERGINVKGYFILGFPTETRTEMAATQRLIHDLWDLTDNLPGHFRASVFEFRPYPGTPEWNRLLATGRYTPGQLMDYTAVDLTRGGANPGMDQRDEFNFSVGIQFGEPAVNEVRAALIELTAEQHTRAQALA